MAPLAGRMGFAARKQTEEFFGYEPNDVQWCSTIKQNVEEPMDARFYLLA